MIIRSIANENLEAEVLEHFDYYNDFKDTVSFLKRCGNKQELIRTLEEGNRNFIRELKL